MTLIELIEACDNAVEYHRLMETPSEKIAITLEIPKICRTKRVEVFPGCFAENLGCIPIGPNFGAGAKLNGTLVLVKVSAIREYIESQLQITQKN